MNPTSVASLRSRRTDRAVHDDTISTIMMAEIRIVANEDQEAAAKLEAALRRPV